MSDQTVLLRFASFALGMYALGALAHVVGRRLQKKPLQLRRLWVFIGIYVLIYTAVALPPPLTALAIAIVNMLAVREIFAGLAAPADPPQHLTRRASLGTALLVPGAALVAREQFPAFVFLCFAVLIGLPILNQDFRNALNRAACASLGLLFAVNLSLLLWVASPRANFLLASLIAGSDVYAILFGGLFGRHPLLPQLSPGKTVEGTLGALVANPLTGVAVARILGFHTPWPELLGLGLVLTLFAQLGDLTASIFKREAGLKDYGTLIPHQGGILDRFDSYVYVVPAFYWITTFLIRL